MRFCPECKARLRRMEGALVCSRCDYKETGSAPSSAPQDAEAVPEMNVLTEGEGKEMLPTIKIDCSKCDYGEAVWWMLQTRSADEPTTQFYRCTGCGHTWRDYS